MRLSIIALVLALGCATTPTFQRTLDVSEDALTTACTEAMQPAVLTRLQPAQRVQLGEACASGGTAALAAQSAYAQSELVDDDAADALTARARISLEALRKATETVLTITGSN